MKKRIIIFMIIYCLVASVISAAPVSYLRTAIPGSVAQTAPADVFRVEGGTTDFVLLDYTDEGFFISSRLSLAMRRFDPDNTPKYDDTDLNNVAYWINGEFLESGKLPEVITRNLVEREWVVEAGHPTQGFSEDYTVKAKVALMSLTEWKKYYSVLGYGDDTAVQTLLRSVHGESMVSPRTGNLVIDRFGGNVPIIEAKSYRGIKPVFYVNKEFFKNEKISIFTAGGNVIKRIREIYTREELAKIYSQDELSHIYRKLPPMVKKAKIYGVPNVGETLKLDYEYFSAENEAEGKSRYRWLRSKNPDGPYGRIFGADSKEYVIKPSDAGYYIKAEILPRSLTLTGLPFKTVQTPVPIMEAYGPRAENVWTDGEAKAGERLIARYAYRDANDDMESGTVIQWQISDDGKTFRDISDANGLNYIIKESEIGKYIRFYVTVKNNSYDGVGETVYSDSIGEIVAN